MTDRVERHSVALIVGAGASLPHLPLQTDLIPKFLAATKRPASGQEYEHGLPVKALWPLRAYLTKTFPGLLSQPGASTYFEDVVGPLEIAEGEEYWFQFAGKDGTGRYIPNRRVLDALDTWLAWSLDPASLPRNVSDPRSVGMHRPARNALSAYAQCFALLDDLKLLADSVFVSLNYDLLLDRAILASQSRAIDYRVEGFVENRQFEASAVPLLKLHGSLNWKVCDTCHTLTNTAWDSCRPGHGCELCGERSARPMLIRPTLLKDFKHRVWRDVWKHAGRCLAGADTWVIVGYSLPLADVWMLRLLAQAIRSGGGKGRKKVVVVNPDPSTSARYGLVLSESAQFLGTFEDWIEECWLKRELVTKKEGQPV